MMTEAGRQRAEKRFQLQQDAARRRGLLNIDEVCQRLRCSRTKFYRSVRDAKTFPRPVVIGARYHYLSEEVDAWYYSQRV